jgi:hypothetical protein
VAKQLAKLLTWASVAACLVVIASFAIFAINQTSSASTHQQEEVFGAPRAASGHSQAKKDTAHRVIDDVAGELTSPFSAITAGASSEWVVHGVDVLGALIVYGFGLGFLARSIRVRV